MLMEQTRKHICVSLYPHFPFRVMEEEGDADEEITDRTTLCQT